VDVEQLVTRHPILFHMAQAGTWPSIQAHGLLSTRAIVDLCQPLEASAAAVLNTVRRDSVTLQHETGTQFTIRDQRPLKFLTHCLTDGTSPQQFLDTLNGRVFFWLTQQRLVKLLGARMYRDSEHTVLRIDTAALLATYEPVAQLAPYNTGSMHVPNAPKRGADVFVDIADYPFARWQERRGRTGDAVVELTLPYSVPDIAQYVVRTENWRGSHPVGVLFER
jgi:hypothetical protein